MHARPDCPVLPDIDKVMINLKTEEFVLDMNTLQALQQLLQWVGDFVLYLLASLPNQVRGRPPEAPPPGFTSLAPPLPGRFSVPLPLPVVSAAGVMPRSLLALPWVL